MLIYFEQGPLDWFVFIIILCSLDEFPRLFFQRNLLRFLARFLLILFRSLISLLRRGIVLGQLRGFLFYQIRSTFPATFGFKGLFFLNFDRSLLCALLTFLLLTLILLICCWFVFLWKLLFSSVSSLGWLTLDSLLRCAESLSSWPSLDRSFLAFPWGTWRCSLFEMGGLWSRFDLFLSSSAAKRFLKFGFWLVSWFYVGSCWVGGMFGGWSCKGFPEAWLVTLHWWLLSLYSNNYSP